MITFFVYISRLNKKRWNAFLLSICIVVISIFSDSFLIVSASTLSENEILAKSCAVIDGYNNRILFDKNANEPMANASTTKIMTCILTLENTNLNDMVLISRDAANQPKVRLGLTVGKEYLLKDLVYGLMLESFNDCAVAIAEHVAGDVESFAAMMNEKAKKLGCKDTYFVTPNGLDAEREGKEHHSTAADLCRIMKYCVWESASSKQFLEITQTLTYECKDPNGQMHLFANHNQLYANDENAISGKTGYTAKAGYCYVTAYEEAGMRFCIALLGCGWPNHKDYKWIDSRKIIDNIKKEYVVSELKVETKKFQTNYCISNGYSGSVDLNKWQKEVPVYGIYANETSGDYSYLHMPGEDLQIENSYRKEITAPLRIGDKIGYTSYYLGEVQVAGKIILSAQEVRKWNLKTLFWAVFLHYF